MFTQRNKLPEISIPRREVPNFISATDPKIPFPVKRDAAESVPASRMVFPPSFPIET